MATADKGKKVYTNVHGGRTGAAQLAKPVPTNQGAPVNQGTSDAKKRFFAAVSPSEKKAKMMPHSMQGMAKQVMGEAGSTANNRMAQIQKLMPQKKPELISYETNPNMDWRQAAAINQSAMGGYNQERQAVINQVGGMGRADVTGQHGMDQTQQRGANQLATTAAAGQNKLNQISAMGGQSRQTKTMDHGNAVETLNQQNVYNKEKDNRGFITSAMSRGAIMDETAQNAYNTPGAFDTDINGITISSKQQKPRPKPKGPRQLTFNERRELEGLPRMIEALEDEQKALYAGMADPALYQSGEKAEIERLQARLPAVEEELTAAYARWEELEALHNG